MKFGYSILYVESVPETVAFYERAFGLDRRMITPSEEYGEMDTGQTKLAFAANSFATTLSTVPFEAAARARRRRPSSWGW